MANEDLKAVRPATLLRVLEYVQTELGLSIYGPCRDLDDKTEAEQGSLMDYSPEDCVKLRACFLKGDFQ